MPDFTDHSDWLDTCGYLGLYITTERPGRQEDQKTGQGDETERMIILERKAPLPVYG